MELVYRILDDGGFIVGDLQSKMTSYAYPSSPHALTAQKHPQLVAEDMIHAERTLYRTIPAVKEYDRNNWLLLSNTEK